MNMYLHTRLIPLLAALFCLLFTASNTFAADQQPTNRSISDLLHKVFRITTQNGKQTMTLITGYSGEPWEQEWWGAGYTKPCINNIAMLGRIEAATVIEGTNNILAFLDCPAASDGGAETIVSLFEGKNTDVPTCFSHIDLMDRPGYFFWGEVKSIEVREEPDNTYIVVPTLFGGDGGDSWVSYAFLHMDRKCGLTLLSRFYAAKHDDDMDDSVECGGENLKYKFESDTMIEVQREKILCIKGGRRTLPAITKRIDLNTLRHKPEHRIFEP